MASTTDAAAAAASAGDATITLSYWGINGRSGATKMMLALTDQQFNLVKVDRPAFVATKEKKTDGIAMFGSLPCLEDTDDDVKLNQSGAMLVYVAMKGGAHPKSHGLQARVIMFVETAEDIRLRFWKEKDKTEFINDGVKVRFGPSLEALLKAAGGKHFVGSTLSAADVAVYDALSIVIEKVPDAWDSYPTLKAFIKAFDEDPKIVALKASDQWYK